MSYVNKDCDATMLDREGMTLEERGGGGEVRASRAGATLEEREGRGDA